MTDRELLELAAKAAGYDVAWNEHWQCFQHRNPKPDRHGQFRYVWVPLDDDGDALRLAVALGIQVTPPSEIYPQAFAMDALQQRAAVRVGNVIDPFAATRRAIVRVAAEIGKVL